MIPNPDDEEILTTLFNRSQRSWSLAAIELGIKFISPFEFKNDVGDSCLITGLLPDFGSKNGTLIISRLDDDYAQIEAEKLKGFNQVALNPRYYDRYNRELFIDTLCDWGWFGKEEPPPWFTQKISQN